MMITHVVWIPSPGDYSRFPEAFPAPCTRIAAFRGEGNTPLAVLSRFVTNAPFMRLGNPATCKGEEIARTLTHLKALHFLSSLSPRDGAEEEYFLIAEDDHGLAAGCDDVVRRAPSNFDVLLLNPPYPSKTTTAEFELVNLGAAGRSHRHHRACMYVVTRRCVRRMLSVFDFNPLINMFTFLRPEIDALEPYLFDRLTTWTRTTRSRPELPGKAEEQTSSSTIAGAVEHVVYINLDRDDARRAAMETQLAAECSVACYSRLRAIDPSEYKDREQPLAVTDTGAPVRCETPMSTREVACTLSHLKALHFLSTLTENDAARFLVLEDDVDFWNARTWFAPADFGVSPLANILRRAPPRFEVLLLHHYLPTLPFTADPALLRAEFSRMNRSSQTEAGVAVSAAAYVITRGAIRRLFAQHVSFDPVRDQFSFRDNDPLKAADKWAFQRLDTWVYKYNFLAPTHVNSTLDHPLPALRLFDFHVHRQMSKDAASLSPSGRIFFDGAPEPTYADVDAPMSSSSTIARGPFSRKSRRPAAGLPG